MDLLAKRLQAHRIYKLQSPESEDKGEWLMCRQRPEELGRDCIALKPSPLFRPPSTLDQVTYFHEESHNQVEWQGKSSSRLMKLHITPSVSLEYSDDRPIVAQAQVYQSDLLIGDYQVVPTRQKWA